MTRSTPKLLSHWASGGIDYTIWPAEGGAILTAVGPGIRFRVVVDRLDDAMVAEWLTLTDTVRARRAEDRFRTAGRAPP